MDHRSRARMAAIFSTPWLLVVGMFSLSAGPWVLPSTAEAQTKTCGTPVETTPCPAAAPIIPPWGYYVDWDFTNSGWFSSPSAAVSWWGSEEVAVGNVCTADFTGFGPQVGQEYWDGILYYWVEQANYNVTGYPFETPACSESWSTNTNLHAQRLPSCPVNTTATYSAGPPTVGPYCTFGYTYYLLPPDVLKSVGCPTCNRLGADAGSGKYTKADPIDITNGNLYLAETDYVGAGSNPLQFVRTYNSLRATEIGYSDFYSYGLQSLGPVWTGTYFQSLYVASVTDSTTTYTTIYANRPDGRTLRFVYYAGAYVPDADVADVLTPITGGYQYQTADDTIETYNSTGQLQSIAPRGRAPLTVTYDYTGSVPASVSDAFGHALAFTYSYSIAPYPTLVSITDPAGNSVSYAYDSHGNLTTATYQDGSTRTYVYDSGGCCMTGSLNQLTDEAGAAYATWAYWGSGFYVSSFSNAGGVNAYSFSLSGTSTTVTDPLGTSRTYNLTQVQNLYRVTSSSGLCPACGEDASRSFDANGNVTLRTDFNGHQTSYSYDQDRNLETSRTEAYGTSAARTISTTWDSTWNQPDLVTEPARKTAFTYDSLGNVLTRTVTDLSTSATRTWTYTYDSYGRMLTAKGPRTDVSSTTTYAYYTCTTGAQCGQLHTVTDPSGNVTTYNTYNAHGKPLTITDPNGVVTTLTYDSRQRLTSRQVGSETTSFSYYATGLLKRVTLPDSSYVQYTYDGAHRLTQITDGAGNSIQYTLDNMGNRTGENTYDPSSTLHRTHTRVFNTLNELYQDINAAGTSAVTTTYAYDSNGNQTGISAPLSRSTANAYDALNRLGQITDPASGNTYFSYDAENDLTSVKDPLGFTTSYTYNGFGDVTALSSPDTGSTTSTYDSGGNLATSIDARSVLSTYSYDAANRVTSIAYSLSSTTDQTLSFGYDSGTYGKGRLTSASDANHSLAWTYDGLGRVTGKGLTVGSVNLSVGYGYTSGDRTSLVTPSGQSVTYGFNSNHQVTTIAVNGTNVLTGITYEPFGGVNGWTWGDGSTTSRTFNGDGLISQIVTAGVTLGYSFDNANRISGISDSSNSALTWSYGYDLLDRLTSATTSAITGGWAYDANGNQLTQTGSTPETFSVSSSSNQLTSTSGTFARTYSYDSAGHATSYGSLSFTYNDRGRMMATSAYSTDYLYNALGQMYEKSGTPGTTIFMQDEAGHLIGEYDGSGNLIEETVWLGDIPVATLQPNGLGGVNVFYVHTDHLNAPRKVAQPTTGTLAWRWDADPFGAAAPNSNPAGLGTFIYNLRFPGQYYQAETGLNQNWNRDYDPLAGKYVESDPVGLRAGVNTYDYVRDNPLSYNDPSGLDVASHPQCDGYGNYEAVLSLADKTACDAACSRLHEETHIADYKARYGVDSCSNKPKGYLPWDNGADYRLFRHQTECKAYRAGKACREKLLTGCCKDTAQRGIDRDNQEINQYCYTTP